MSCNRRSQEREPCVASKKPRRWKELDLFHFGNPPGLLLLSSSERQRCATTPKHLVGGVQEAKTRLSLIPEAVRTPSEEPSGPLSPISDSDHLGLSAVCFNPDVERCLSPFTSADYTAPVLIIHSHVPALGPCGGWWSVLPASVCVCL